MATTTCVYLEYNSTCQQDRHDFSKSHAYTSYSYSMRIKNSETNFIPWKLNRTLFYLFKPIQSINVKASWSTTPSQGSVSYCSSSKWHFIHVPKKRPKLLTSSLSLTENNLLKFKPQVNNHKYFVYVMMSNMVYET